jgi:hypothetical protein
MSEQTEPDDLRDTRFARDVTALHRLGERVLFEFLDELGRDRLIRTELEGRIKRYISRLSPEILRLTGGDKIAPSPIHCIKSER